MDTIDIGILNENVKLFYTEVKDALYKWSGTAFQDSCFPSVSRHVNRFLSAGGSFAISSPEVGLWSMPVDCGFHVYDCLLFAS